MAVCRRIRTTNFPVSISSYDVDEVFWSPRFSEKNRPKYLTLHLRWPGLILSLISLIFGVKLYHHSPGFINYRTIVMYDLCIIVELNVVYEGRSFFPFFIRYCGILAAAACQN